MSEETDGMESIDEFVYSCPHVITPDTRMSKVRMVLGCITYMFGHTSVNTTGMGKPTIFSKVAEKVFIARIDT